MTTICAVLAAGNSSRLGQPKQLVEVDGEPLVAFTCRQVRNLVDEVIVVTGAFRDAVEAALPPGIIAINNATWQHGMGTSIAIAADVARERNANALLLTTCDLPHVVAEDYQRLLAALAGHHAAAARYEGTIGIPAVFDSALFHQLMQVEPTKGAKRILCSEHFDVAAVDLPNAAFDVDTPEDLIALNSTTEERRAR